MKNVVVLKGRRSFVKSKGEKERIMGPVMLGYIALGLVCFVSVIYFCSLIGLQGTDVELGNLEKEMKRLSDQQASLQQDIAEQKSLTPREATGEPTTSSMVKVTSVSYLASDQTVAMAR